MRERLARARAVIRRGMCHKGDTLNACSYCQEKLAALQGLDEIEEYVPAIAELLAVADARIDDAYRDPPLHTCDRYDEYDTRPCDGCAKEDTRRARYNTARENVRRLLKELA